MKTWKKAIFGLMAIKIFTALSLTGCDQNADNGTPNGATTHTVTFETNEGSNVPNQTVGDGKTATRPANPIKTNFIFDDWYTEPELQTVYDFDMSVTKDMTLYAKWLTPYTVTFDTNGGSSVPSQTVGDGKKANRPQNPSKTGHSFAGWYNEALAAEYDFDTPITANITVYAKWNVNVYTVTFAANGGSETDDQHITHNEKATRPANPERNGHGFVNWYSNEALTVEYDFDALVTGNITLYAKWEIVITYKMTIRYGGSGYQVRSDAFNDLPLTIPPTGQISITIPAYDDVNNLSNEIIEQGYAGVSWFSLDNTAPYASYNNLPVEIRNRITANGITIHLNTASASNVDVSLTHIHYLRQAFTGKGIPNEKIIVNAPENKFAPVYDGYMWNAVWYWGNKSLYDFYPNMEFMNGIFIAKNSDNLSHRLVYSRPMKITSIGWEPVQWYGDGVEERSPIIGIGLEKAAGGSLSLASDMVNVTNHGSSGITYIGDFGRYVETLREHNLHPDNGVYLNHWVGNRAIIHLPDNASDADHNYLSNGMYDFILAYYNPPANYVAGSDPAIDAKKDKLPLFYGRRIYSGGEWTGNYTPLTFYGYAKNAAGDYLMTGGKYTPALPQGKTSRSMVMARKRKEKEKDIIDQLLDNINFKGLTQDEVVGRDGIIRTSVRSS